MFADMRKHLVYSAIYSANLTSRSLGVGFERPHDFSQHEVHKDATVGGIYVNAKAGMV